MWPFNKKRKKVQDKKPMDASLQKGPFSIMQETNADTTRDTKTNREMWGSESNMTSISIDSMRKEYPGKTDEEAAVEFAKKRGALMILQCGMNANGEYTRIVLCRSAEEADRYFDSPSCSDGDTLYDGRWEKADDLTIFDNNAIAREINFDESGNASQPCCWNCTQFTIATHGAHFCTNHKTKVNRSDICSAWVQRPLRTPKISEDYCLEWLAACFLEQLKRDSKDLFLTEVGVKEMLEEKNIELLEKEITEKGGTLDIIWLLIANVHLFCLVRDSFSIENVNKGVSALDQAVRDEYLALFQKKGGPRNALGHLIDSTLAANR